MAETAKTPATKVSIPNGGDRDRVVMASRKPDGTPDQTADFEYIGDKATTLEATKVQLAEQATSAVDTEKRAPVVDEGNDMDPDVAALKAEHEKVAAAAEKQAEAEVDARFTDEKPAKPDSK
jgi:hypothetical protein